jgi:C1A family cysteine protease
MSLILGMSGYAQSISYPNPSVAYIEKMGYGFSKIMDADGNEQGNVIFPDGSKADAWAFLRGKAGQKYSYCVKKGYTTESKTINHGSWTEETSVCSKVDNNGKVTEIPMLELMEANGEPLIEEKVQSENNNPPDYKYSTNLKSTMELPSSFDWRSYNGHSYIGPVRNQGNCGSCYSFAANATAEGVYNFATGNYDGNCIDLSESFIMWCLGKVTQYGQHFSGCVGADLTYYELQALVDSGATYEANFPYQTTDPVVCTHWNDPRVHFNDWYRVGCSDIAGIKTAIMTYGVVDAAVIVTAAFNNYTGGVYSDTYTSCNSSYCEYTPTNHAIALVGWGVDPVEGEYWILRNSWGSNWGEGGYMRIKTTSARVACEVAYLVYNPVVQGPPIAETNTATGVSNSGAVTNGIVNASNLQTIMTFQYGLTTSYSNSVNATPGGVNGNSNTPVNAVLTGLLNSTTYHYRVKAVNSMGTTYGNDLTFTTTSQGPPLAISVAATNISYDGATANGTVNANNLSTSVTFQYGLTTSYGNTVNAVPYTVNGTTNTAVSAMLSGLLPNTTYHFMVIASNSMGTAYGNDLTFTTLQNGCADNYEPNNSQATSALITTGTGISGLINPPGDIDWFKFSNTSSQKNIKVELYDLPADYDLQLYDANGKVLKTSQKRGTTPELINYNTAKVASYYIKVYGYSSAYNPTNCFTLKVSLSNTQWRSTDGMNISDDPSLSVYPNPTSGKINLDYISETSGKCNVRLLTLTGALVVEQELTYTEGLNFYVMDLSGNSSGIYFLELTNDSDRIFKKVILQK